MSKSVFNITVATAVDASVMAMPRVQLVTEGLDTVARVLLNGHLVGHANNMFRRWTWDVKPYLLVSV